MLSLQNSIGFRNLDIGFFNLTEGHEDVAAWIPSMPNELLGSLVDRGTSARYRAVAPAHIGA